MANKIFFDLDTSWVNNMKINLSAVERRTATLTKRRTVKKEFQVAWLLKAITLIDLTTLSGDDTFGKVERLCNKIIMMKKGRIEDSGTCHELISKHGRKNLEDTFLKIARSGNEL